MRAAHTLSLRAVTGHVCCSHFFTQHLSCHILALWRWMSPAVRTLTLWFRFREHDVKNGRGCGLNSYLLQTSSPRWDGWSLSESSRCFEVLVVVFLLLGFPNTCLYVRFLSPFLLCCIFQLLGNRSKALLITSSFPCSPRLISVLCIDSPFK